MSADPIRLADRVYQFRLEFLDVTIGVVVGRRGAVLIDCGTTLCEAQMVDHSVRALTGAAVTDLVLTHHHFDHILGSSVFAGAVIHAAPGVAETMRDHTDSLRADALRHGADQAAIDEALAALPSPGRLIGPGGGGTVDLGDRRVRIRHLGRGHTGHDLIVVVPPVTVDEPTVVFCGDLVEESGPPMIGADAHPRDWPATLERLLAVGGPHARYVPGHGAAVDAGFVREQRDWLAARAGR